ncbi:MAG: DUF924 family protein [Paracoccaceae bacterium]|jgi:uncharacterized protein (DUF924 family)
MATAEDVIRFWEEIGPEGWYSGTPELDERVRAQFLPLWQSAREGGLDGWRDTARGALALILVLDQFPRNMFRDHADSFATDHQALAEASRAIAAGHDLTIPPPMQQFFYLPFMHSEDLVAQNRGVALFAERMPGDNLRHARAHEAVIARFGRFPWRNPALGRVSTGEEQAYLEAGGYAATVKEMPGIEPS